MPPADPDVKIPCATSQELQHELDALSATLGLGEREETWERMEKALIRFAGITRGGGYKHLPLYVEGVGRKGVGPEVALCMLSDKGRLSGVATELLQTLAPRLGHAFAPLVPVYFDPLIKLLGRPNKVFLKRAEKCLITIMSHCQLPSILTELRRGLSDDAAASCRRGCALGFDRATKEWGREVIGEKGVAILEDALRKMATDKDPEVRKTGRTIWAKYNSIWPERVEDFSAPLTPTIRRYLEIPSNGGPSKGKSRSPPAPVSRPISTASSATTSDTANGKPQPQRLQALVGKPARVVQPVPPLAPKPEPIEVHEVEKPLAGPSRHLQISPRKAMDPPVRSRQLDIPPLAAQAVRPLPKSTSVTGPYLHDIGPAPRFAPSRSVSHNILPSAPSFPSMPTFNDNDAVHNPLSRPVRPTLPTSYSTTAIPSDPSEALMGAKRMPRRPFALPEEDDGPTSATLATPGGPLRGAARVPQNPAVQGKRNMLGQARRVVTAPAEIGPMLGAPTPAVAPRTVSRSVKDRVKELERNSPSPTRIQETGNSPTITAITAANIPLPSSPTATKSAQLSSGMMIGENPPVSPVAIRRQLLEEAIASPMMPVMIQRTVLPVQGDASMTDLRETDMEMGDSLADQTILAGQVGERMVPGPVAEDQEKIVEVAQNDQPPMESVLPVVPATIEADVDASTALSESTPPQAVASPDITQTAAVAEMATEEVESKDKNDVPEPIGNAPAIEEESTKASTPVIPEPSKVATQPIPPATVKPSVSTKVEAPAPINKPAPSNRVVSAKLPPKARPDVKLPSVTARAQTKRVVSAPERKPFKPTSHAAKTVGVTAPTASTALRAAATSKPPVPPAPVARVVSKGSTKPAETLKPAGASTTSISSMASDNLPKPPGPRAAPTRGSAKPTSNFAAPTKASSSRTGPTSTGSAAMSASTSSLPPAAPKHTATVTLPPVKKERIRLKPPVPRFVPTKNRVVSADAPTNTSKLAASTSSTTGNSIHGGITAKVKARVKPESIPLPLSPHEKAKLPPHAIPLPKSPTVATSISASISTTFKEGLVAKVKLPDRSDSGLGIAGSPSFPRSPRLPENIPLPETPMVEEQPGTPTPFISKQLDDRGLPKPPSNAQFTSLLQEQQRQNRDTPISKASTEPPMSDDADSDSDDNEHMDENEMDGVTFKYIARNSGGGGKGNEENVSIGRSVEDTNGDRSGKRMSTTPKSSPTRGVLQLKDANTPRRGVTAEVTVGEIF